MEEHFVRYLQIIAAYLLLIVMLAACQPAESTPLIPEDFEAQTMTPGSIPESTQAGPSNPLLTPEATEMPATAPPVEKFVSISKKDLASRLQIDAGSISLVRTEDVLWPNAALGCPRPGKVYAQGRVPGYRVWLNAEGKEYLYHTDYNGQVILCPELNPDVPGSTTSPTPKIGVPYD
jgi:hypothetical protein